MPWHKVWSITCWNSAARKSAPANRQPRPPSSRWASPSRSTARAATSTAPGPSTSFRALSPPGTGRPPKRACASACGPSTCSSAISTAISASSATACFRRNYWPTRKISAASAWASVPATGYGRISAAAIWYGTIAAPFMFWRTTCASRPAYPTCWKTVSSPSRCSASYSQTTASNRWRTTPTTCSTCWPPSPPGSICFPRSW